MGIRRQQEAIVPRFAAETPALAGFQRCILFPFHQNVAHV